MRVGRKATGQNASKQPRTARGAQTMRKLLDAAEAEFGERGFHDASVSGITRRAGTALGSFYTYFDTKDDVFRALVQDMSERVKTIVGGAIRPDLSPLDVESTALSAFLEFVRTHKEIYRIIDEAEFVDPASYRAHYETTASRIEARLAKGIESGEYRPDLEEAHAWAIMGMNVFLGLRYGVWTDDRSPGEVAEIARSMLERGIANPRD